MANNNRFFRERNTVIEMAKKGIQSNIPLGSLQKKYLKNLLLFSMMNASNNESVTNRNFIKLVNRLFKKFLVEILTKNSEDDDEEFDENLEVELNNIIANEQHLSLQELQALLTPANIVSTIKANTNGLSQRQILNRLLALRDAKANHRETPEEARERERRQKEYELQKMRERMMEGRVLTRGAHER